MTKTIEIPATELATLQRKAIAHDDYLAAIRTVEKHYAAIHHTWTPGWDEFVRGYGAALEDLARTTEDAVRDRLTEADMVGTVGPPELFDRDVPELPVPRG